MKKLMAAWLLLLVPAGAEVDRWSELGRGRISQVTHAGEQMHAESCRSCHTDQHEQWSRSRHAQAWSNPIFQEGYLVEPEARCLHCHKPVRDERVAHEGVNCVTCHVRDGKMYSVRGNSDAIHPLRTDRHLASARFCASCHQFNIENRVNGRIEISDVPAQNTYQEWLTYRDRGGTKTCQQCHMPGGNHFIKGAHDGATLAGAVEIRGVAVEEGVRFELRSREVGHDFPTGDIFRRVTLEVQAPGGAFSVAAVFGRKFGVGLDAAKNLSADTSLKPFEVSTVLVPIHPPVEYRLRYHYVSEKDKRRSHLPKSHLTTVFLEGTIPH